MTNLVEVKNVIRIHEEHKWALQYGLVSINEIRVAYGFKPIEGGDVHFIMTPTGAVPVEDIELYFSLTLNKEV